MNRAKPNFGYDFRFIRFETSNNLGQNFIIRTFETTPDRFTRGKNLVFYCYLNNDNLCNFTGL